MERRLLLAFVLSAVIFAVWSLLFPPAPPPGPPAGEDRPAITPAPRAVEEGPAEPRVETPAPPGEAIAATAEEVVRLQNGDVAIGLVNRGAAISSFQLLHYEGDERTELDLVQTIRHSERTLPLQLVEADGPDERLYVVDRQGSTVTLRWADGAGSSVEKRVTLADTGYSMDIDIRATGRLREAAVSVGTGLRDLGPEERNSRLARWGDAVLLADGEYEEMRRAKVKEARALLPQTVTYAGLQDTYFVLLLRPQTRVSEIRIEPIEHQEEAEGEEPTTLRALRLLVRPADGMLQGELLGAPKEYQLLHDLGGGVERTLDFGLFGPISVLFLKALWWIYGLVGNYGTAIVLLTVAIRVLLFPLMHTSTVSMRKMQKLQPRIKEIQARHKKKKGDPQARAKMNQEMMALYKQEGVNPMGGCLPMLVQLPILWALYKLFLHAIELRHAPFVLWIHDLSAKDPYYITPILMTATMWLQQRLAPQAGDPQQQRIMRMMPLIFGIMFLQFPSGLVLYWLTNNVITIIQQEVTLHLVGERSRTRGKGTTT